MARQLLLACLGQVVDLNLCGSDGSEAGNLVVINDHIGGANVVTELVLSCEFAEKAVEVGISRVEATPSPARYGATARTWGPSAGFNQARAPG